ncbi:MAG: hypothetical protein HQ556_11630 [Candidatus Marinimicrobia bacterium]|nr:hypothetical protein [Candidatus Neomarinimicrobiota bacterium]
MKIQATLAIISLSLLIFSCSEPKSDNNSFEIYFLADSDISEHEASEVDIGSLALKDEAWVSSSDIDFYDYSSHCIYLKEDKSHFFENYDEGFYQFTPVLSQKPFVVVSGGTRVYVGALHSGLLSLAPAGPYMDEMDVGSYPADVMHISKAWRGDEDIRSDPDIKDALLTQDLFHAGLKIQLISFQVLDNSDTSTVEYRIRISNNDQDDLYILDPTKMGSALFHYYTNGPDLWDTSIPGHPIYLYSQYKLVEPPEPYDSWEVDWFSLIESGNRIEHTIQLKGYPFIPDGSYTADMKYAGPHNIGLDNRYIGDGRLWIGSIGSNTLDVTIQ